MRKKGKSATYPITATTSTIRTEKDINDEFGKSSSNDDYFLCILDKDYMK